LVTSKYEEIASITKSKFVADNFLRKKYVMNQALYLFLMSDNGRYWAVLVLASIYLTVLILISIYWNKLGSKEIPDRPFLIGTQKVRF